MANHRSAKKRIRQTTKKTEVNRIWLSRVKKSLNKFNFSISEKNLSAARGSLSLLNSVFAKAVKKGVIKKMHASRKLSSLSYQLKKIT